MSTFIMDINAAALKCQHPTYREGLRAASARLYSATFDFKIQQDKQSMQNLVAAWTRAAILMRDLPPPPGENTTCSP